MHDLGDSPPWCVTDAVHRSAESEDERRLPSRTGAEGLHCPSPSVGEPQLPLAVGAFQRLIERLGGHPSLGQPELQSLPEAADGDRGGSIEGIPDRDHPEGGGGADVNPLGIGEPATERPLAGDHETAAQCC